MPPENIIGIINNDKNMLTIIVANIYIYTWWSNNLSILNKSLSMLDGRFKERFDGMFDGMFDGRFKDLSEEDFVGVSLI